MLNHYPPRTAPATRKPRAGKVLSMRETLTAHGHAPATVQTLLNAKGAAILATRPAHSR